MNAAVGAGGLGCYVHVPFCARVCPYCDFAVVAGRDEMVDRYVEAVIAEIEMEPEAAPLDTVFVGGGTPSRISPDDLTRILSALDDRFGLSPGAEVTLEANPEDWSVETARGVVGAGITRVSFGAQSFDKAVLGALGRRHTPEEGMAAVRRARDVGSVSVSLDLIFGAGGESLGSWRTTVETAVGLDPDHISTYALTVERGTELARRVAAGAPAPDPDDQAAKYDLARRIISEAGFRHYEVSNYATPGHECRYNSNTWAQGDYLAFGLGAHGHREGVRRHNVRRLEAYLGMVESGRRPEAGREEIRGWDGELERVFLGIRRRGGVEAGRVGAMLAADPTARRLVAAGKLEVTPSAIRVLDPLFTDAAARVVIGLAAPEVGSAR